MMEGKGTEDLNLGELRKIIDFSRGSSESDVGFGDLDRSGKLVKFAPVSAITTARMTFCFATAKILEIDGCEPLVTRGIEALGTSLRDSSGGGWYSSFDDARGTRVKSAYQNSFVLLASAAAESSGDSSARELIDESIRVIEQHFWNDKLGILWDEFSEDFSEPKKYLGANSNMHAVEALLAASNVLQDESLVERADMIAEFFINKQARAHDWKLPEHFDEHGEPDLDYGRDKPNDVFKPYGVTIGHLFEWSRLLLELDFASRTPAPWRREASLALFETAKRLGWNADGMPGFVYTTDFDENVVVPTRLHWVACEALAAASSINSWSLGSSSDASETVWSSYLFDAFRDSKLGGWHHELDPHGVPSELMFQGKPDAYHLMHGMLIPQLPKGSGLVDRIQRSKGQSRW